MPPGRYPHRVTHQTFTDAENAYGDVGQGDGRTWSDNVKAWVRIEPISGREFIEGQRVAADATHRIWARYRTGWTPDQRLIYKSRAFHIISVINVGERNRELEIICKEVVQ